MFLGVSGKNICYGDASGMTVAETGAALSPEVVFEGFFSRSAILRKRARADLASAIEMIQVFAPSRRLRR